MMWNGAASDAWGRWRLLTRARVRGAIAVCDVGTNTVLYLLMAPGPAGAPTGEEEAVAPTRLGEGLAGGDPSASALARTVTALAALVTAARAPRAAAGGVGGFLLGQAGGRRWGGTRGHGRVVDWFGAVPAIAPICAAVVHEPGVDALDFAVLHAQTEQRRALEQLGISLTRAPWPWTVKVLDLAAVLDGWVGGGNRSVRIVADGEILIVATDETEVAIEEAHAVNALLFNDAEHWPDAVRRLPAVARAALAERLPVPICSYGVNYI